MRGPTTTATFSVLISGGTVVDGSGAPGYRADLGLHGDAIAAIGDLGAAGAELVIDARGLTVSPGFVDVHVHSELAILGGRDQLAGVRQGITTNLLAPDGFGWAPLEAAPGAELFAYTAPLYGNPQVEAHTGPPSTPTWTASAAPLPSTCCRRCRTARCAWRRWAGTRVIRPPPS